MRISWSGLLNLRGHFLFNPRRPCETSDRRQDNKKHYDSVRHSEMLRDCHLPHGSRLIKPRNEREDLSKNEDADDNAAEVNECVQLSRRRRYARGPGTITTDDEADAEDQSAHDLGHDVGWSDVDKREIDEPDP